MKNIIKLFFVLLILSLSIKAKDSFPSSYYKLNTTETKKYFFKYFNKRITIENKKILKERAFILSLNKNKNLSINSNEYKKLQKIKNKYKISHLYNYKQYLTRIDIIPPSLALAQAATESGWGKSRFFKQAKNIFGHWTYNAKIGMLPLRRDKGKKHFIRIFPSLQASIEAYMLNLNRTRAYSKFRLNRKKMRDSNKFINGLILSKIMSKYSGIGHSYVTILISIIKKNNLVTLDKEFYNTIHRE